MGYFNNTTGRVNPRAPRPITIGVGGRVTVNEPPVASDPIAFASNEQAQRVSIRFQSASQALAVFNTGNLLPRPYKPSNFSWTTGVEFHRKYVPNHDGSVFGKVNPTGTVFATPNNRTTNIFSRFTRNPAPTRRPLSTNLSAVGRRRIYILERTGRI